MVESYYPYYLFSDIQYTGSSLYQQLKLIMERNSITILITYKNKLLLLSPDIIVPKNSDLALWGVICGKKTSRESYIESVARNVKFTTRLSLDTLKITKLQVQEPGSFYHVVLTDREVNLIERRAGQRLEFFDFDELPKIPLNLQTQHLVSKHAQFIQELLT